MNQTFAVFYASPDGSWDKRLYSGEAGIEIQPKTKGIR